MFFIEITCPVFQSWDDVIVNTTDHTYQTVVNYTCSGEMVLPKNKTFLESKCEINGEWTPSIQSCQSMFKFNASLSNLPMFVATIYYCTLLDALTNLLMFVATTYFVAILLVIWWL